MAARKAQDTHTHCVGRIHVGVERGGNLVREPIAMHPVDAMHNQVLRSFGMVHWYGEVVLLELGELQGGRYSNTTHVPEKRLRFSTWRGTSKIVDDAREDRGGSDHTLVGP